VARDRHHLAAGRRFLLLACCGVWQRRPGRDRGADEPAVDVGSRLSSATWMRSAIVAAISRLELGITATNSSPPQRATILTSQICAMAISANICKVRSPTA